MSFEIPSGPTLTIVGGQPTKSAKNTPSNISRGVEEVLVRASNDDNFARRLVRLRVETLGEIDLELSTAERATLLAVSDTALMAMIRAITKRVHQST